MNQAVNRNFGFGLAGAAVSCGGYNGGYKDITEEFNGVSWSSGNAISGIRGFGAACGTSSAGLIFGGWDGIRVNITEEYNGTNWSVEDTINITIHQLSGCGQQTSALHIGGWGAGSVFDSCETYNGAVWANAPSINNDFYIGAAAGAQNGHYFGGQDYNGGVPFYLTTGEDFNGAAWFANPGLNTVRAYLAGIGSATRAESLAVGGNDAGQKYTNTEQWNGTSWSNVNGLNVATAQITGVGILTSGLVFGGQTDAGPTAATEEWDDLSYFSKIYDIPICANIAKIYGVIISNIDKVNGVVKETCP